ncbi:TPA: XRE family transcriptional regulator [Candidatus Gastranaerophilales bacterium HUM_6]|jgi:transcriptional regulator with XRE-family HTH domain|nr:XRE family transcriptional regulator [bacterium]MEE0495226.1 helix-turn-helix transcriptional regulator [Cyanobacteriota bacterium]CDE92149.1 helix-turn-helix domain protein [Fusobacterium sp. CAG:815]DAA89060.1 MAG TPA: XRE family transcriptional regulator [Candidatus Gastranaerophilales bacterium HUM_6]DAA89693.1 MAG TPA: XRE family transcriptional regulator [Candidatus Gastranaerophilales bacterium HUM_7]DAB00269.1 MAG TPA: XRE family transcriptional regulator [Candidatus Gastranaerophil
MTLKQDLGQRIQKLRKDKKITQEQLAEMVGIDPKNISRIEKGNNYPTAENLTSIAKALHVDIYELFVFNSIPLEQMKEEIINSLNSEKNILHLYQCLKFEK